MKNLFQYFILSILLTSSPGWATTESDLQDTTPSSVTCPQFVTVDIVRSDAPEDLTFQNGEPFTLKAELTFYQDSSGTEVTYRDNYFDLLDQTLIEWSCENCEISDASASPTLLKYSKGSETDLGTELEINLQLNGRGSGSRFSSTASSRLFPSSARFSFERDIFFSAYVEVNCPSSSNPFASRSLDTVFQPSVAYEAPETTSSGSTTGGSTTGGSTGTGSSTSGSSTGGTTTGSTTVGSTTGASQSDNIEAASDQDVEAFIDQDGSGAAGGCSLVGQSKNSARSIVQLILMASFVIGGMILRKKKNASQSKKKSI